MPADSSGRWAQAEMLAANAIVMKVRAMCRANPDFEKTTLITKLNSQTRRHLLGKLTANQYLGMMYISLRQ